MFVDVIQPPMLDGVEIEPHELDDYTKYFLFEEYPGSAEATFPEVAVTIKSGWSGDECNFQFAGVWRAALLWDFGKDMPASPVRRT